MKETPNAQPTKTGYVNRTKVKVNRSNALAKTSCQFFLMVSYQTISFFFFFLWFISVSWNTPLKKMRLRRTNHLDDSRREAKAAPLTYLKKKGRVWDWTIECQKEFSGLKRAIKRNLCWNNCRINTLWGAHWCVRLCYWGRVSARWTPCCLWEPQVECHWKALYSLGERDDSSSALFEGLEALSAWQFIFGQDNQCSHQLFPNTEEAQP